MIQAAGNDTAVAQNADLIPKTITEYLAVSLWCRQIRPVEFITVLQKNLFSDTDSFSFFLPGFWENSSQCFKNLFIFLIGTAALGLS